MNYPKPLSRGDQFPTAASFWNPVIESANRAESISTAQPTVAIRNPAVFQFRNNTGVDLDRYHIIEPFAPFNDPDDNETEFDKGNPILLGRKPSGPESPIAIVTKPAKIGQPGHAVICGAVQCSVDASHTSHQFAVPIADDTTKLKSNADYGYPLLTSLGSTGTVRAIILAGCRSLAFVRLKVGVADAAIPVDSSGVISIWRNGADTNEDETAVLDWMHSNKPISAGKQVLIARFPDESLWRIVGAECENAS